MISLKIVQQKMWWLPDANGEVNSILDTQEERPKGSLKRQFEGPSQSKGLQDCGELENKTDPSAFKGALENCDTNSMPGVDNEEGRGVGIEEHIPKVAVVAEEDEVISVPDTFEEPSVQSFEEPFEDHPQPHFADFGHQREPCSPKGVTEGGK